MIQRTISFRREGLQDLAGGSPDAINEMQGKACALWLRGALSDFPNDGLTGPGAEDWGWYLGVTVGRDTYMIGCSSLDEHEWIVHVSDFYIRGVFPWTRRRRLGVLDRLATHIEKWIAGDPSVTIIVGGD